jgi:hypothetical protein
VRPAYGEATPVERRHATLLPLVLDRPHDPSQEMTNFTKNMALLGGACFAAAVPEPWPDRLRFDALEKGTSLALT